MYASDYQRSGVYHVVTRRDRHRGDRGIRFHSTETGGVGEGLVVRSTYRISGRSTHTTNRNSCLEGSRGPQNMSFGFVSVARLRFETQRTSATPFDSLAGVSERLADVPGTDIWVASDEFSLVIKIDGWKQGDGSNMYGELTVGETPAFRVRVQGHMGISKGVWVYPDRTPSEVKGYLILTASIAPAIDVLIISICFSDRQL